MSYCRNLIRVPPSVRNSMLSPFFITAQSAHSCDGSSGRTLSLCSSLLTIVPSAKPHCSWAEADGSEIKATKTAVATTRNFLFDFNNGAYCTPSRLVATFCDPRQHSSKLSCATEKLVSRLQNELVLLGLAAMKQARRQARLVHRDQSPRPVSPKNGETRTGHPPARQQEGLGQPPPAREIAGRAGPAPTAENSRFLTGPSARFGMTRLKPQVRSANLNSGRDVKTFQTISRK
jgi:hypothetical protein